MTAERVEARKLVIMSHMLKKEVMNRKYWGCNGTLKTISDFCFNVQLNFTPKIRKSRNGPNLTRDQIPMSIPPKLTKRMVLSQVNGIYDALGLATPLTVRAKMLMRKLLIGESATLG